jgi:histidinol dehydrogenase
MSFNTLIDWNSCSPEQQRELLMRPAISASKASAVRWPRSLRTSKITATGRCVNTARSLIKPRSALRVTEEEIQQASSRLSDELKQAMQVAVRNIDTFHTAQILPPVDIETQPACAASRLPALSLPWACIFLEVQRRCSLPY